MPTLPTAGQSIAPPSPVPKHRRPFNFGEGTGNFDSGVAGPQGPQGPAGPQGPTGPAGTGTSAPIDVPAGTTYTVASNTQVLYVQPITVEGRIVIQGSGMLINVVS